MDDPVFDGPAADDRASWAEAYASRRAADVDALGPDDLHHLGMAAYLTGHDDEGEAAMARAHRTWQERGELRRAAREAFWIGLMHVDRHAMAPASGWFARGQRLIGGDEECAEVGLFIIPAALGALLGGDPQSALAEFRRAGEIGQRVDDHDLCALARLGEGQALISTGRVEDGMRLLDEVMVGVVAREPSPLVTGLLYCAVIETCQSVLDLRRSSEWTDALGAWCDAQPGLESHRGRCLVHRASVHRYRGEWDDALAELDRARVNLGAVPRPALGAAYYELGELHRLRGEVAAAEDAYLEASRLGHDPRPGLARLRLLQGRADDAWASLADCDDEADPGRAAEILSASIDVALAMGRVDDAAAALDRLDATCRLMATAYAAGLAGYGEGRVLLARDDPAAACGPLRAAIEVWRPMPVPLEVARARVALGRARLALGDRDSAVLELDAARRDLTALGAAPDLRALAGLEGAADVRARPLLTEREVEVLAHAARGLTNREIAAALVLSQHTVRRHLQNVFSKVGASTRAGAVTRARELGLLP